MNTSTPIKQCPLCGKDNGCCAGQSDCWCFSQKVPKTLIDQLPDDQKNKACICTSCIDAFNNTEDENDSSMKEHKETLDI